MIVTGRKIAKDFINEFSEAENSIEALLFEMKKASWSTPNELKSQYRSASIIGAGCVVFNICGNKYRLVAKIEYESKIVRIRWAGRHKEYEKLKLKETKCLSSN
ncbi:MAG: type II toxin-antitoxin system HigB family toxin [Candidatus Stygibacter australis]|nr:type II toxin-antitoxin system HigB family toxin [Candidatus Stygibacter australis]MDP8322982.1 type II toxin-antitoxin system HigB family toxin [Candidatus Stygibacter australis]